MRSRLLGSLLLLLLAAAGAAVWFVWPHALGSSGKLTMTPVALRDLPGWVQNDPQDALAAFRRSCALILRQRPDTVMSRYAGHAADWRLPCKAASSVPPNSSRTFFETSFTAFEIDGDGLFTGYYEPLLRGSLTRHDAYQTPIYAVPDDLVDVDLGVFRPELKGEHIEGRLDGRQLVPYSARADIDARPPHAPVLFYGDDAVSVFFLHIQGSGRVALDNGSIVRIAYAGQNGRPYTAIGRTLIRRGALTRQTVSMQSIRAWLKNNPLAARNVMETDESYIFFNETAVGNPSLGSVGTEGVALTPLASIAVDSRIHALGVPFFIATTKPDGRPLQGLFIAQDTGGAIRGAARADIFFGFGASAEALAGEMKSRGRLFVLLPNDVAKRLQR